MRISILIFLSLLCVNASAQQLNLKLASDVWPPFTDQPDKQSFAIDLVQTALNRSGIKMNTKIIEFEDVLDGIKGSKYDGSAALWYSEEREEFLQFSEPYLQNQLILVAKKGGNVQAQSFAELKGQRIAVVENYAYGADQEETEGVTFIEGKSDQDNLDKLLNDEADYLLVDALLIQYLVQNQQEEASKYLEIGETPLMTKSLHFSIRKDFPNADLIVQRFDKEIKGMVADGTYHKILQLNWIRTDINGDGELEFVLNGDRAGTDAPTSSYDVFLQSASANNATTGGYYVGGSFYKNWDNIPSQYKVAPIKGEDLGKIGALDLRF